MRFAELAQLYSRKGKRLKGVFRFCFPVMSQSWLDCAFVLRLSAAGLPRSLQHDHRPRPLGAPAEGEVSHISDLRVELSLTRHVTYKAQERLNEHKLNNKRSMTRAQWLQTEICCCLNLQRIILMSLYAGRLIIRCMWPQHHLPEMKLPPTWPGVTAPSWTRGKKIRSKMQGVIRRLKFSEGQLEAVKVEEFRVLTM